MSVQKPRTRVVYFRISEEEFGKLNQLCQEQGARSLSDLARTAMQDMLGQSNGEWGTAVVANRLQTLERAVSELNEAVRSITSAALPERVTERDGE
jgi:hypothetical protein